MDTHRNPNLETTHQHHLLAPPLSSSSPVHHGLPLFKNTHREFFKNLEESSDKFKNTHHEFIKNLEEPSENNTCSVLVSGGQNDAVRRSAGTTSAPAPEESGRERLKRHRVEMSGRVWIPDIWGQEELLKDWIDCAVFDSSLGNNSIMSARAALVQEARRVRIENRC